MNEINKIIIILISFLFISCNVPNPPEPHEYKINYDLDGGLCNDLALEFEHNEIVILPTPVKEGFIFIGWIDADTNEVVTEITNKDYKAEQDEYIEIYTVGLADYALDSDTTFKFDANVNDEQTLVEEA